MKKIMRYISEEEKIYELNNISNINRGTLIEIHIADIHFGDIDPKIQYAILEEQFINKIENMKFDILSIDGDLFKHKYMSNSETVMYATMFINRLVNICKQQQATLILIHGTLYHDASQLKLFYHYLQDPTIDIRIVEDVRFEYVKGAKILCIPELYGMGSDYYNEFLLNSQDYDSVFMHGMFEGSIYGADSSEINSDKAPTFNMDSFALCKGPIISGHVHTGGCFSKYFYYTGSPIRTQFGEEGDKGFLVVLHNLDTHQHYVHLETIKSFRYDTVNLDHLILQDPKVIIEYVNKLQSQGIDNIRVKLGHMDNEQAQANIEILKKYYRSNPNIKLKTENIKNKQILQVNEEALDKYKEFDFILDSTLSEHEILVRYINKIEKCEYITIEELKSILEEVF